MNISNIILFAIIFTATECEKNPNVLFFVVDDLRPYLSIYGDPIAITPNIEKLSKIGYVFKNAYAQQALCGPSRTSFLTSRRPDSLKLIDVHSYWRTNVGNFTTIPQHFKENNYYTVSVGKVFHKGITSNHTDDYPLSWSQKTYHGSTEKYKYSPVCLPPLNYTPTLQESIVCPVDLKVQPEHTLPDIQATEFAVEFIRNYSSEKPLFLAVGFHKPHIPLKYPSHFLDYYPLSTIELAKERQKPKNMPNVAWNPFDDMRMREDIKQLKMSYPFGLIPDYYQKLIKQSYYAAITYMDSLVGKVVEEYQKKFTLDNTIITFIGDHGWSLGEHGEWSKYSTFNVATRVPMVIVLPQKYRDSDNNIKGATVIDKYVELVDLFPTLADLAGISVPPMCKQKQKSNFCTEGLSMKPLLLNKQNSVIKWKRLVFSQYPRPSIYPQHNSDQPKLRDVKVMGYTMKNETLRYTEWIQFNPKTFKANWSQVNARELYFDSDENQNLASQRRYKNLIKQLSTELQNGWRHAIDS